MNKVYPLILIAATMCFASRIGVLKSDAACPGESVTIMLNTENHKPLTRIVSQKIGGVEVPSGTKIPVPGVVIDKYRFSITFNFCVFDVPRINTLFMRTPYPYAVLLLDDECPAGAKKFKRHHDTEDKGDNYYSGNVYPNVIGHNADLYYCYIPAIKDLHNDYSTFPSFDNYHKTIYGIFASTDFKYTVEDDVVTLSDTEIFIDDEDDGNENSWNYYGYSSKAINKIMSGNSDEDRNTIMHVAYRYIKSTKSLRKSVSEEAVAKPVNVEQLAAPAIKGFNHSVVTVELKSAGDVHISIVNVNGAVVANIVEKDLQSGVHQVKWNSGIIPNGRYIVTVKQNGMANSKNVILK